MTPARFLRVGGTLLVIIFSTDGVGFEPTVRFHVHTLSRLESIGRDSDKMSSFHYDGPRNVLCTPAPMSDDVRIEPAPKPTPKPTPIGPPAPRAGVGRGAVAEGYSVLRGRLDELASSLPASQQESSCHGALAHGSTASAEGLLGDRSPRDFRLERRPRATGVAGGRVATNG